MNGKFKIKGIDSVAIFDNFKTSTWSHFLDMNVVPMQKFSSGRNHVTLQKIETTSGDQSPEKL